MFTPFAFVKTTSTGPAPGPTPWTPADMTTLGWWDAANVASITLNGSTVSQWNDLSGNGYNATQATATKQPAYGSATLNGYNILTFDAVDDSLALPGINFTDQSLSMFMVLNRTARNDAYAVGAVIWKSGTNAVGLLDNFPSTGNKWGMYTNDGRVSTVGLDSNYAFISQITNTAADPGVSLYTNGAATGTHVRGGLFTGASVFSQGGIGADQYGSALAGDVAELIVVDGILNNFERQRIEGYLAWKWGLEANLPTDHPYYNNPPYVQTPIPASPIVSSGLVAYYDAAVSASYNGSGTTVYDLSGTGNDLTLYNYANVTYVQTGSQSYFTGSVARRAQGYGGATINIPSGSNSFSIGGWCTFNNLGNVGQALAWGIGADTGTGIGGIGLVFPRNASTQEFQYGTDYGQVQKATSFSNNTWYNIMATIENTGGSNRTVTLYLNGSSLGSSTISDGGINTTYQGPMVWFGGMGTDPVAPAYVLNGKIAVMYVYDTALSAGDVLTNFNVQKSRYGY